MMHKIVIVILIYHRHKPLDLILLTFEAPGTSNFSVDSLLSAGGRWSLNLLSRYSGDSIPRIDYTTEEISTWTAVFNTVLELMPKHACVEYRRVFKILQDDDIFRPDRIPQLEEMSAFMKSEYQLSPLNAVFSPSVGHFRFEREMKLPCHRQ
jgi:hypothetical protein